MAPRPDPPAASLRIDKWLWHARLFRTRSLAAREVAAGHVRVDGNRVTKPSAPVREGVTLTFPKAGRVWVVRVVALGVRRGPATEARALYEDLSAPPEAASPSSGAPRAPRFEGRGRPSGRDRRRLERLRGDGPD